MNITGLRCSEFIAIRNAQQEKMHKDMGRNLAIVAIATGIIAGVGSLVFGVYHLATMPFVSGINQAGRLAKFPASPALFALAFSSACGFFVVGEVAGLAVYGLGSLWISYKVNLFAKDTDAFRNRYAEDAMVDMQEIDVLLKQCSPELVAWHVAV